MYENFELADHFTEPKAELTHEQAPSIKIGEWTGLLAAVREDIARRKARGQKLPSNIPRVEILAASEKAGREARGIVEGRRSMVKKVFSKLVKRLVPLAYAGVTLAISETNRLELSYSTGEMDVGSLTEKHPGADLPTYGEMVREVERDYFSNDPLFGVGLPSLRKEGEPLSMLGGLVRHGERRLEKRDQALAKTEVGQIEELAKGLELSPELLKGAIETIPVAIREHVGSVRYDPIGENISYKGAEHLKKLAHIKTNYDGGLSEIVFKAKELVAGAKVEMIDDAMREGLLHEYIHASSPLSSGRMDMAARIPFLWRVRRLVKEPGRPNFGHYPEDIEEAQPKDEEYRTILMTDALIFKYMQAKDWPSWQGEYAARLKGEFKASEAAAAENARYVKEISTFYGIKPWEFSRVWNEKINELVGDVCLKRADRIIKSFADPLLAESFSRALHTDRAKLSPELKKHQHDIVYKAAIPGESASIDGYRKLYVSIMHDLSKSGGNGDVFEDINSFYLQLLDRDLGSSHLLSPTIFLEMTKKMIKDANAKWSELSPKERAEVRRQFGRMQVYLNTSPKTVMKARATHRASSEVSLSQRKVLR